MRKNDVEALLAHSVSKFDEILKLYRQSLSTQNIPDTLRIEIKNMMENMRSALDYIALDILELIIIPSNPTSKHKAIRGGESIFSLWK